MNIRKILGRKFGIFDRDYDRLHNQLSDEIYGKDFLVIGGAGSIGSAVSLEIFKHNPRKLHVVDINENNLTELVRDIRSSLGYIDGDFSTYAIDCGSQQFKKFINEKGPYNYVLNLSALKHVRSEKDPFTLSRMIDVNIINIINSLKLFDHNELIKYFSVSTDKATNPINMMGASKRIMELILLDTNYNFNISSARFANVAFSDGSLLHGFTQRILKKQPITAPRDIKRYFITPHESAQLCLVSTIFGNNKDIFFPRLNENIKLTSFIEILEKYLATIGYEIYECSSENEARSKFSNLERKNQWPCYFFNSDTTGEKEFEEFYKSTDKVNYEKFSSIGVIEKVARHSIIDLNEFILTINKIRDKNKFNKNDYVLLFKQLLSDFDHIEKGKSLDERM
jgi:FlaA1/EpsC-like NDP-sugar epimerase